MEARKRRRENSSLAVVEKRSRVDLETAAAIKVQRAYTRKLAVRMERFGVTSAFAKKEGYPALALKLREDEVIKTMRWMLLRVCDLTEEGVKQWPEASGIGSVKMRVFLTSYMIAYHPKEVFEEVMALEKGLVQAACAMLEVFDGLCDSLRTMRDPSVAVEKAQTFPKVLSEYLKVWHNWKKLDAAKMEKRIEHSLSALCEAEALLDETDPESEALREEFRGQRVRLGSKLRLYASEEKIRHMDALLGGVAPTAATGNGMPTFKKWEDLRVTNEQMAHGILLDPTYSLDATQGGTVVQRRIRDVFRESFWKSLTDDLRFPFYGRLFKLFQEIVDGVMKLVEGFKIAHDGRVILQVLDLGLIKQEVGNGAFTWETCQQLVANVERIFTDLDARFKKALLRVGEKVREPDSKWVDVKAAMEAVAGAPAEQPGAFCAALKYLVHSRLSDVSFDAANLKMSKVKPTMLFHGIEYERDKFKEKLDAKEVSLGRTEAWLLRVVRGEVTSGRVALEDLNPESPKQHEAYMAIVCSGIAGLMSGDAAPSECPETLLLDAEGLAAMHADFLEAVRMLAILESTGKCLARAKERAPAPLLRKVGERLLAGKDMDEAVDALYVCEALEVRDFAKLRQTLRDDRTVPQMMKDQLRNLLRSFYPPPDCKLPAAAVSIRPRISALFKRLHKVQETNLQVHHAIYNELIAQIVGQLYP
jgi:hypothetical protein